MPQVLDTDVRWAHLPDDHPLAPARFAPERWLPGGGAETRAGGWIPFGAGARMCLGYPLAMAEMKVRL
jgi:cytochrome P450